MNFIEKIKGFRSSASEPFALIVVFLAMISGFSMWMLFTRSTNVQATSNPLLINFQAKLTDQNRITVPDSSLNVKFAIYDASSGGTCYWSAKNTDSNTSTIDCPSDVPGGAISVTPVEGVVSVVLGDTTTSQNLIPTNLFNAHANLWLGVTVGSDSEMTPRIRLTSTPYAFYAGNADLLDGLDSTAFLTTTTGWTLDGTAQTVTADKSITLSGGVDGLSFDGTVANTLSIDTANGRIGIGTATPSYILHTLGTGTQGQENEVTGTGSEAFQEAINSTDNVYTDLLAYGSTVSGTSLGITRAGMSSIDFNPSATGVAELRVIPNVPLVFGNNNVERMRIDVGGNVGIGTSTPGSTFKTEIDQVSASAGSTGLRVNHSGAQSGAGYAGYFQKTGAGATNIGIWAESSGGTANYAGIFATGNVGIGDTDPAALFTVGNGDKFQVDSSGNLVKLNDVTYSWPSSQATGTQVLQNDGSGNLSWASSSACATCFVNNGNTFGGAATVGTNDNFALNFETNNSTKLTLGTASDDILTVTGGTLSTGKHALKVTTTLPASSSGNENGVEFDVTAAGSSTVQARGLSVNLLAGSATPRQSVGMLFGNETLGTGTQPFRNIFANYGSFGYADGAGSGANVGSMGEAFNSTTSNFGVAGLAQLTSVGANVAVIGLAQNSGAGQKIGGYFALDGNADLNLTEPSFSADAALVANNGNVASDIFQAMDSGTTKFRITDGGDVILTGTSLTLGNQSSDPTGANGMTYYNTGSDKFRCFENGAWKDCDTTGGGSGSLQDAYDNGATITTSGDDIAFTLASGNFVVNDSGSLAMATFDGSTGAVSFANDVALGDSTADTISVNGRINTPLKPTTDDTLDIGDDTHRWANLFLGPGSLHVGTNTDDGTVSYDTTLHKLNLSNNGTTELSVGPTTGDIVTITGGTLATGKSALVISGTITSNGSTQYLNQTNFTYNSGSTGFAAADLINISGTFNGSSPTQAVYAQNLTNGIQQFDLFSPVGGTPGNVAVRADALPANGVGTTGTSIGIRGLARNSSTANLGVAGLADDSSNAANATFIGTYGASNASTNGTSKNIGVYGNAQSGSVTIGGYFGLNTSAPTFSSAALVADNGSQAQPIFLARDNSSTVFTIADGGAVTATSTLSAAGITSSGSTNITSGGVFLASDGTVGAPAFSFTADTDSGLYRVGANDIALSVNGVETLEAKDIGGGAQNVILGATTLQLLAPSFALPGTPQYSFVGDTDTGINDPAANRIGFNAGGVETVDIDANLLAVIGNETVTSTTTTGTALGVTANSITTGAGSGLVVTANGMTSSTGNALRVTSTGAYTGTNGLLEVSSANAGVTGPLLFTTSNSTGAFATGGVNFNFSAAHTGSGVQVNDVTTAGTAMTVNANSITTGAGSGLVVSANGLTSSTGNALRVTSTGAYTGTNGLLEVSSANAGVTGPLLFTTSNSTGAFANGGVRFNFSAAHTGNGLEVDDVTTAGTAMALNDNSLVGGTGFAIASSATGMTGALQSITLSGTNSGNTGTLLNINSSGAASVAKGLKVAVASTGDLGTGVGTGGGVNFNFSGAHGSSGFQVDDATQTGTAVRISAPNLTTGSALSVVSSSATQNISLFSVTSSSTALTNGISSFFFAADHSGDGFRLTDVTTTGVGEHIITNSITSGIALDVTSTSATQTGNSLLVQPASTGAYTNGAVRFNISGDHTGNGFQVDDVTTAGTVMALNANSITTGAGSGLVVTANGITSGTGDALRVTSSAAYTGTNGLFRVTNSNAGQTGPGLMVSSASTGAVSNGLVRFNFTGAHTGNGLEIDDAGTGTGFALNTTGASGTIEKLAYGGATTLTGSVTGLNEDLKTNVTNAAQSVTGYSVTLPGATAASTTTIKGLSIASPGAVVNAAGTSTWTGLDLTMPAITQSAGTLTSTGIAVTGGTVTSGTSYAFTSDANAGNFGIGDTSPAALLTVGNGDLFQVNSSGAITAVTGITDSGDIAVNGSDLTTTSTGTATVFDTNALTVNLGGAATTLNLGGSAPSETANIAGGSGSTGCTVDTSGNFACTGTGTFSGSTGLTAATGWTLDGTSQTVTADKNMTLSGGVNGLSFDGTTFSVDATNHRIGIGTAAPAGKLEVTAGTLSATADRIIKATGTLASGTGGVMEGNEVTVTTPSSSSATHLIGNIFTENGSYTGTGLTRGLEVDNLVAGTGAGNPFSTDPGNIGIFADAEASTAGSIVGVLADVRHSTLLNVGVLGKSGVPGTNGDGIGVGGFAANATGTGKEVGGYFAIGSSSPTLASTALLVDNNNEAFPIAIFRDAGTAKFTIADGGDLTSTGDLALNGSDLTTTGTGTATVFDTNALTVNLGGAATTLNLGGSAPSETANIAGGSGSTGCTVDTSGNFACTGTGTFSGSTGLTAATGWTLDGTSQTVTADKNMTLSGGVNGLSFDGTTFSVDATNHRIGIGTAAPTANLDVQGTTADASIQVENTGASNESDLVSFNTTSNVRLLARAFGSGVGSTFLGVNRASAVALQVDGSSAAFLIGTTATAPLTIGTNSLAAITIDGSTQNVGLGDTTPAAMFTVGNGDKFQVNSSGVLTSTVSTGNSVVIDTSTLVVDATNNRVGIGTASPTTDLDVQGTSATAQALVEVTGAGSEADITAWNSTANSRLLIRTFGSTAGSTFLGVSRNSAVALQVDGSSSAFLLGTASTQSMTLGTNSTAAITIDGSTQKVGIGNASPGVALDVTGAIRDSGDTTLGDASGDSLTVNAATWSIPNATTVALANVGAPLAFTASRNGGMDVISGKNTSSGTSALADIIAYNDANNYTDVGETSSGFTTVNDSIANQGFINSVGAGGLMISAESGSVIFGTGTYGSLGERKMTLTNGGNFGIGDATPAALLTVGNGDLFQVSSGGNVQWNGNGTFGDASGDTITSNAAGWSLPNATTFSLAAGTANAFKFTDGSNPYVSIDTRVTTSGVSAFTVVPSTPPSIATASGAEYTTVTVQPPTITLTGTTSVTSQMDSFLVTRPIITDSSAVAVTSASSFTVDGAPQQSGSATIASTYGIRVNAGTVGSATASYGLFVDAMTGAASNYGAVFNTGNVGIGTTTPSAPLDVKAGSGAEHVRLTDAADSIGLYVGSGTPESAVTAQLGSQYYDRTNGTSYIKASGDNTNTGWAQLTTGVAGANTALSNLASVAINTSLLPAVDDSIDLGDNTHRWANAFLGGQTVHIGASTTDEGTISYNNTSNAFTLATDATSAGNIALAPGGTGVVTSASSTVSGTAFDVTANSLVAGTGVSIDSTNTGTTGSLLSVTSASAAQPTNGLVRFNFTGNYIGPGVQIDDTSNLNSVGMQINANNFTTAGGTGLFVEANGMTSTAGNAFAVLSTGAYTGANGVAEILTNNSGQTGPGLLVSSASTGAVANGLVRFNSTGNHTGNGFEVDDVTTGGTAMAVNANSITSGAGNGLVVTTNGMTSGTGNALLVSSSAAYTGANGLFRVNTTNTGQTGPNMLISSASTGAVSNGLARYNFTGAHAGNGLELDDATAAGSAFALTDTALTTGTGISETLGSALTTGSGLSITGASYNHSSGGTEGDLVNLSLTDASSNTSLQENTFGLNIATAYNTTGAGDKNLSAIRIPAASSMTCGTSGGQVCSWNGIQLSTPAKTQSNAVITKINGLNLDAAGALVQNTSGSGNIIWNGLNVKMPNITQTTGFVTSTGLNIAGGAVTSGNAYAITTDQAAGNIGFGTTSPTASLHVDSDHTTTNGFELDASSLTTGIGDYVFSHNSTRTSGTLFEVLDDSAFYTATNNLSGDSADIVQAIGNTTSAGTLTASGATLNVIREIAAGSGSTVAETGTVMTVADLDAGSIGTHTSSNDVFRIEQDYASNTGTVMNLVNAGSGFSFRVNDTGSYSDTSPFVINNGGNVYIGTTAPAVADRLFVSTPNADEGLTLQTTSGSGASSVRFMDSTGTNQFTIGFNQGGNELRINSDDGATATSDFVMESSGLIGIGTATASSQLTISGAQPASVATSTGTVATDTFGVLGVTGGATTIATTGIGGEGSDINLTTGNGGVASSAATSSSGGGGGDFTLTGGTGGSATTIGTTRTGGQGGTFSLTAGTGGTGSGGTTNNGGSGGTFTINAGAGGTGATAGGAGGVLTLHSGNGGSTNGNGGNIALNPGVGSGTGTDGIVDVAGTLQIDLLDTATINGVCHSGADTDTTGTSRNLVACSNTPNDIAEWYESTGTETAGDIVVATATTVHYQSDEVNPLTGVLTGNKLDQDLTVVAKASAAYANVLGVVSTSPAQTYGRSVIDVASHPVPIAITGRVPVKVNDENGAIVPGDAITASSTAGQGMKATEPGMIIGYALDGFAGPGQATVLVSVHPGFHAGGQIANDGTVGTFNGDFAFTAKGTADGSTQGYDSYGLSLRGSGWDGAAAQPVAMTLVNDVTSGSDYKLSIRNTSDAEVAYVTKDGAISVASDVIVGGKLYPSASGVAQTDKYIFYGGVSDDFMRTNATGWGTGSYDFAEMFPSKDALRPGDVVAIDTTGNQSMKKATSADADHLAGIVSTKPGFIAGDNKNGDHAIALSGRVPTNVSVENGAIAIGDALTVSTSKPGFAMKATAAGTIVGFALEPASADGSVVAFVHLGYWQGTGTAPTAGTNNQASSLTGNLTALNMSGNIYMQGNQILNVGAIAGIGSLWSVDTNGKFLTEGSYQTVITSYQNKKVTTNAMLSTEQKVTLSGTGHLTAGTATVTFEDLNPDFNDITSTTAPVRVLVTLRGPANGIYVSVADHNGFTAQETMGGTSDADFDWYVEAYRKDYDPPAPVIDPNAPPTDIPPTDTTVTPPIDTTTPPADTTVPPPDTTSTPPADTTTPPADTTTPPPADATAPPDTSTPPADTTTPTP